MNDTPLSRVLNDIAPLPKFLNNIANIVGRETALRLARRYGGQYVFFPMAQTLTPEHPLSKVIGYDNAFAISQKLFPAGVMIYVPRAANVIAAEAIWKLLLRGYSIPQTARACRVSARTVYRHKQRLIKKGLLP